MDNDTPEAQYSVNLDKVAGATDMLAVTRLLAAQLQANPYTTVGDFLKGISNEDLETLIDASEDEEGEHFPELIIIAEMLAVGEGVYVRNLEAVTERLNYMRTLLIIESLHRKKMIRAVHANMSFGEDAKHKIVAEKI